MVLYSRVPLTPCRAVYGTQKGELVFENHAHGMAGMKEQALVLRLVEALSLLRLGACLALNPKNLNPKGFRVLGG